jgi:6-pyruvoyltetrahydropterin/6-carboxytetrahydropterin synthase
LIHVTRRYRISASHRLHSPELSEEENRRVFGKCNNPHGHGHDYTLEITARGPLDERSGMAVSPEALDRLVGERVLAHFHLRNLNEELPEFAAVVPTTENLARAVAARLDEHWREAFPGEWPRLDRVRILETKRNRFELRVGEA